MARRVHSGWPRKQLGTALETGEHAHEQLDRYHAVIARRARIRPLPRRGAYARADGRVREQQFLFALGRLRQEAGGHLAQARRCAAGSRAAAHHARPALLVRPADARELLTPRARRQPGPLSANAIVLSNASAGRRESRRVCCNTTGTSLENTLA